MFKISSLQNKDLLDGYAALCGTKARHDAFVYVMTDCESGELMAIAQFEILAEKGYIFDLRPVIGLDDFEAMFILGRQTMNFIDTCGAHTCLAAKNAADEYLLKKIGFKPVGDEYFCDMTGMFDGHCSGHAVTL